jgi:NAD(P)-dependent dehydrogenase (short-subunit alcohol dehydrogenase family)
MDLHLQGKVILITGGVRGIGGAIARALIAEGAIALTVDRETGGGFLADLCEPDACRRAVRWAVGQAGRVDGLVNNAGVNDGCGLADGSPERFLTSIGRNLTHYYAMAHYALPALIASQGAIVNITSKVAETGQGGTSGYAAANGGRNALTREWAAELASHGVRVNAVAVAECWTPMYEQWAGTFPDPAAKRRRAESRIPLGRRMTTPEEIAAAVLFLLSPVSSHTTGQILYVDGGYTHLDRALTGG